MKKTYSLDHQQEIRRSRSETFAFFADAFNLERITPSFLHFRILTPAPILMRAGTVLEYRLSLFGVAFHWKTLIEQWSPEESFVDVQLDGPYSLWRHTHTFEEIGKDRTLVRDHVEYQVSSGVIGRLANALFVARTLEKIFAARERMIDNLLAPKGVDLKKQISAGQRD